jgi:hypothetical protein
MTQRRHLEDDQAVDLIRWRDLHKRKYPELGLLYHCPNGGFRNAREGARLKAQGVLAGIPDYHLPIARQDWHSAYFELKAGKGKPTEAQLDISAKLLLAGNYCQFVTGWVEAARAIARYLGLPEGIAP